MFLEAFEEFKIPLKNFKFGFLYKYVETCPDFSKFRCKGNAVNFPIHFIYNEAALK